MEQQLAIKFRYKAGKSATESLQMVNAAYEDQALSRSNVFRWYGRFRDGREDVEDDPRSGQPTECCNDTMSRRFPSSCFKLSPFAKNAGIQGEYWQGHSEKDCS